MTPVTKDEFDLLFDTKVVRPLCQRGFQRSGKSLWVKSNLAVISLIRLGGRMAQTGAISQIACCRMSFMRDRTETVPKGFCPDPYDYPYKILPAKFSPDIRYSPQNLNYSYERFVFETKDNLAVTRELENLATMMLDTLVPWAMTLTADFVKDQLNILGEGAWCETLWIEDCERYIARSG